MLEGQKDKCGPSMTFSVRGNGDNSKLGCVLEIIHTGEYCLDNRGMFFSIFSFAISRYKDWTARVNVIVLA
jgi:hypothetical protein